MNGNKRSPSAVALLRQKFGQKQKARKIGEAIVEQLRQRRLPDESLIQDLDSDDVAITVPASSPTTNT